MDCTNVLRDLRYDSSLPVHVVASSLDLRKYVKRYRELVHVNNKQYRFADADVSAALIGPLMSTANLESGAARIVGVA
jgi:endo-1,4-beta-mannosidase